SRPQPPLTLKGTSIKSRRAGHALASAEGLNVRSLDDIVMKIDEANTKLLRFTLLLQRDDPVRKSEAPPG
ncbi:MAG: hypothetical protein AB7O13_11120, partial [Alphaproteobacteria bacterium]